MRSPSSRDPDEVDFVVVAECQRWLMVLVVAELGFIFAALAESKTLGGPRGDLMIAVGSVTFIVLRGFVFVVLCMLLSATRANLAIILLYAFCSCIPLVSIVLLITACSRATSVLRRAGLPVGWFGVRDADVCRFVDSRYCRSCGYDLTGNVSGRCPECGEAVAKPVGGNAGMKNREAK